MKGHRWILLAPLILLACEQASPPTPAESTSAPPTPPPVAQESQSETAPSLASGIPPLSSDIRASEGDTSSGGIAALSGVGQDVAFNLGAAADYANALTAYEMAWDLEGSVRGPGAPEGHTRQRVVVRQGLGPDFEIHFAIRVQGADDFTRASGYDAVRKGPWFYFRAGNDKHLRRTALEQMTLTRFVKFDGLRAYLDFVQRGSKFAISRSTYLGRSMRVYRLTSSLPLEQNPLYAGSPPKRSSQSGEIWIDEASSLVFKFSYQIQRESAESSGGSTVYDEKNEFAVVKIGTAVTIEAPADYYESAEEKIPVDTVKVPVLQDPR
ncbi:MAG: hypothetical protein AB1405_16160 [Bdellovibrionota bacterium]